MTENTNEKNINELSFEEAMAKLDEIVSALEKGDAPLESSLEMFEEGVKLTKLCSSMLESASQKVTLLTSTGEVDFRPEANAEK